MKKKIFILIPAFNEELLIGKIIDDLRKVNYKNIVVINDGSTDNTEQIAMQKGVIVLSHVINLGQGASLITGTKFILKNNINNLIIVHFDSDGQMSVNDIPAMVDPILDNKTEITLGSRFMTSKPINMSFSKFIILWLAKIWLRFLFNVRLSDVQCGFRAMSRKAAKKIKINYSGPEHASEILIEIFKKKIPHMQIPVTIKYTDYSESRTQHGKFHFLSALKIAYNIIFKRYK